MDMSVTLNLSYTTAAAAQVVKTPEIVNQPKVEVTAQAAREPRRDDVEKAVTDIR